MQDQGAWRQDPAEGKEDKDRGAKTEGRPRATGRRPGRPPKGDQAQGSLRGCWGSAPPAGPHTDPPSSTGELGAPHRCLGLAGPGTLALKDTSKQDPSFMDPAGCALAGDPQARAADAGWGEAPKVQKTRGPQGLVLGVPWGQAGPARQAAQPLSRGPRQARGPTDQHLVPRHLLGCFTAAQTPCS